MSEEKKNSFAVESHPILYDSLNEIFTAETAREKFPNCDEDFYNQIIGKTYDYAWDVLIEMGNRTPSTQDLELGKDLKDLKEKYFGKGKIYYQEKIKLFKKKGLENIEPFNEEIAFLQKYVE